MSGKRVHRWRIVTHGQRGRERRRWRAPQEVIATICGRESVWAWESRVGTLQLHQFALALTQHCSTRLHIAHTHKETHSILTSLTLMSLYDTFLSLTFVPLRSVPAWKPLWVAFTMRKASPVPCGLAKNQNWNTDRGNKGKEQSCSTNLSRWTNPAVFTSPVFKSSEDKHTQSTKRVHLIFAGPLLLHVNYSKCHTGTILKTSFEYESTFLNSLSFSPCYCTSFTFTNMVQTNIYASSDLL